MILAPLDTAKSIPICLAPVAPACRNDRIPSLHAPLGRRCQLTQPIQSAPPARRPCPLCNSLERKLVFRRDSWDVVQCALCRMVFLGNQLTYLAQQADHDWLDDHSREAARRKAQHPALMFLSRLTRPLRPEAIARELSHTLRLKREGNLLDLGCGDGRFLAMAAPHFKLTGVEISPRAAASARERAPSAKIFVGPVTEATLPEAEFDVVTLFGYIEHEWNPLDALRLAYRALRPAGVAVLKTPNYASWNRRVMGADWCGIHLPAHCNYFTPHTLGKLLRQAGFDPLPRPPLDRLPSSDTLWLAARKPS